MSDSIKELTEKIVAFRDARNWKQFHNPKDLAISISLSRLKQLNFWKSSSGPGLTMKLIQIRS